MTDSGKNAILIIIGNEVLSGKTVDKNGVFLTRELRALGVEVQRVVIIPDDIDLIAEEIRTSRGRFDLIFTCGGIGPTHDDVTLAGIALGLGKALIRHPKLIEMIEQHYPPDDLAAQGRLAEVPEGTELIFSEGIRFPVLCFESIYIFPGIPELLVSKFEAIKERFRDRPFYLTKIYLAEKEYVIAETLRDVLKDYPDLLLGSYPKLHHPEHSLMLTLESKDRAYLEAAGENLIGRIPKEKIVKIDRGKSAGDS